MARRPNTDDFYFEGFESPNTTPVPDVVFDRLLAKLGEAELKALLYIIRRTFGFKRDRDPISFNQFLRGITTREGRVLDEGCGVRNRTTLSTALKSLEEKGIVVSEKGTDERGENVTTVYRLRFRDDPRGAQADHDGDKRGVVRQTYHRGTNSTPPVVRDPYPQETGLQETDLDLSNFEGSHDGVDKLTGAGKGKTRPSANSDRWANAPPERTQAGPEPARRVATGPTEAARTVPGMGYVPLAELVARRRAVVHAGPGPRRPRRPRSAEELDEREQVAAFLGDFARELNDQARLAASVTRAINLFKRAGVPRERWGDYLYQTRAITQERTGSIRTTVGEGGGGFSRKNKAPYFFEVLSDLLHLRGEADRGDRAGPTG